MDYCWRCQFHCTRQVLASQSTVTWYFQYLAVSGRRLTRSTSNMARLGIWTLFETFASKVFVVFILVCTPSLVSSDYLELVVSVYSCQSGRRSPALVCPGWGILSILKLLPAHHSRGRCECTRQVWNPQTTPKWYFHSIAAKTGVGPLSLPPVCPGSAILSIFKLLPPHDSRGRCECTRQVWNLETTRKWYFRSIAAKVGVGPQP